jgi:uncharacterized protein (DUF885 family)
MRAAACLLLLVPLAARAEHPLAQRYLDGLFAQRPHLAGFMGDHRFDDRLADFSPQAVNARLAELGALEAALGKLAPRHLDDEVDARILADGIALERLYLSEIRDWEWDPRLFDSFPFYDPREMIAGRLSDLVHGDFAPEAARQKSVVAQLGALPRFLDQAKAALRSGARHPPAVFRERALVQNQARLAFFDAEVKPFVAGAPGGPAAFARARAALAAFQGFLEGELAARADGDFRLGAALYDKKFPLALGTELSPDEVLARARAESERARAELFEVARRLHKELWPKEAMPKPRLYPEHQAQIIQRVRDALAKDHPSAEGLVAAHAAHLDALRAFVEKHDLCALPPRETLRVAEMPAYKRGSQGAEYLAPGVLERSEAWRAVYYVDPIDPSWPPVRVESYLRGQNDYEVQLVAAHEAYPGHHTQFAYARRGLSPLRAVLWNAPMAEGWAVYGVGLLVERGWGGARNLRYRFYDLRGRLVVATNAILDIMLQRGKMTDAQAIDLLRGGFQEQAMAEKKLLRAKLDSTQLVQYFLGLEEIRAFEADEKKRLGKAFRQRAFDEALLGHGTVAVRFLRRFHAAAAQP